MNRFSLRCCSRRSAFQGYTLTELLAGMLVTGITLSISVGSLLTFLRSEQFNSAVSTRLQDMNLALDLIADEWREANHFTIPPTCPSRQPNCIPVLEFKVAGVEDPIRYYLVNQPDQSQALFREGVGFTPEGRYAAGTAFAALVIDRIPIEGPPICPVGSQGAGTAAFRVCIRNERLMEIQLRDQEGNSVNTQIVRRAGL